MLNFNPLDKTSYNDLRLQILAKVEENQGLSTKVYLDSKGIPTIGIGMNLRSQKPKDAVFEAILGDRASAGNLTEEDKYRNRIIAILKNLYPQTPVGEAQLQSDLNAVMAERAADSRITFANKRATFEFADEQEIKDTFNTLIESVYEEAVDTWYGSKIDYSYERLALVSLAYNSPSLLGSKLKAAIEEGNRPEAWYQIRYNSNSATTTNKNGEVISIPESTRKGLAKRRYFESQIFSLYNDRSPNGVVTDAESRAIAKMHKDHATKISGYDAEFESNVVNANRDYGSTALSGGKVQNFRESLAKSRSFLVSQYLSGEDASKINQISFAQNSDNKVAFAASLASDPLVVPLKVKSPSSTKVFSSNLRDESSKNAQEILSYKNDVAAESFDDDTSYYADDDVVYEEDQKVNSLLVGNSKEDVFYIDNLSGSDHVVSTVNDGKIIIDGITLSGKASSRFDSLTGEVIAGEWTLQGFNLKKVAGVVGADADGVINDDLVIYKSGLKFDESTPRVTIKNYPFSQLKPAFGINLDLKVAGLSSPQAMLAERNVYKVGNSVYSSNDSSGKFFCASVVSDDITHYKNYAVRTYDIKGNLASTQFLTDIVEYETTPSKITSREISPISSGAKSCKLEDGGTAFIYGTREYFLTPQNNFIEGNSYAFLAKIDASGKLISNKMVHQIKTIGGNIDNFNRHGYHIPQFVTPNGACFNTPWASNICGKIDDNQFDYVTSTAEFNYVGTPQDNSFAILPTGHKVTSSYQGGNDYLKIAIASPIYAPTPNSEKLPNYAIAGDYETDPSLPKLTLSLSREEDVNLKISSNPNSVLALIGLDGLDLKTAKAKMSFPVNHHSQIEIHSSTDSDYTIDQLLNGEFDFTASSPLKISKPVTRRYLTAKQEEQILRDPRSDSDLVNAIWTRRLGGEEEVQKLMKETTEKTGRIFDLRNLGANISAKVATTNSTIGNNSTDDDYAYSYSDYYDNDAIDAEEINLTEEKYPFTIVKLNLTETESQTVILSGVNATEVAKMPEAYFLTQLQLSQSPTSNPSGNPSRNPSSLPSGDPTSQPSGLPSFNPSGFPTSQPSGEPSSIPSYNPTVGDLIMPSSIPSFAPFKNSELLTEIPSQNPSKNPSNNPSPKPSLKQYAPSEIPSFNPSEKLAEEPTNIPSEIPSKPSSPSKKSKLPTGQPSYSKDTSDLPTSKPSIGEFTSQPSNQPSNQEFNLPFFPSSQPSNAQFISNVPSLNSLNSNSPSSNSPIISITQSPAAANKKLNSNQSKFQSPSATLIGGIAGAVALTGLGVGIVKKLMNKGKKVYADENLPAATEQDRESGGFRR